MPRARIVAFPSAETYRERGLIRSHATTVFPQLMKVDYVRVYQRTTPSNRPPATDEGSNWALALDSVILSGILISVANVRYNSIALRKLIPQLRIERNVL